MKVTVKENDKKVFNPITIELVIENEKELCNLYNRLSIDSDCVNVNVTERLKYNSDASDLKLYECLCEFINKHYLRL